MPTTALGITYPASTDNVQIWTHLQQLAADVDALITADRADLARTQFVDDATWTTPVTSTGTETLAASVTFTAVSGHRYRPQVDTMYSSDVAGDNVQMTFRRAAGATVTATGTLVRNRVVTATGTNHVVPISMCEDVTGVSGQITIGVFVKRYGGSGTVQLGNGLGDVNRFWVDDIRD